MTNAPRTLDELRSDLGRALGVMSEREPEYRRAREYYDGTRAERALSGSTTEQRILAQSKATPISFAHIPVDCIADKVNLSGVTSQDAAGKAALEAWATANDIDDEGDDWITKACYFGDYYAVSDPTSDDEEGRVAPEDIDTVGMSPLSTVVVYDRKTGREALFGLHVWDAGTKTNPAQRAILYYHDASVKLVTASGKSDDPNDYVFDIERDEEEDDAYITHEGDRLLIAHLAIGGKPYGVPLHRRAWAFQDAIAKISANNLVNVDAQGLPSRWALLDPAAEIDDNLDADFGTDGPTTTSGDGQRTATKTLNVRTKPGAVAMLEGVKQTGTYDTGDAQGFLSNLDWYLRGMAVATGIPLFEFDMSGEQPSGESRRRAEARANRKAEKVARAAGGFFSEIGETVLAISGRAEAEVVATFAPVETATDKEGIELVALKVKAGVPLRRALSEAGYSTTDIEEWYKGTDPVYSPEVVDILAKALASLGNAKTLGVISDEDLRRMLPELITASATPEGIPALLPPPAPREDDGEAA
jgi:hypothetical protein